MAPRATPKFRPPRPVPYAWNKNSTGWRRRECWRESPIVIGLHRSSLCPNEMAKSVSAEITRSRSTQLSTSINTPPLAGGKYFSTLDLSNQLVLDESARKYQHSSRSVQIHQVTYWCRFCTRTLTEDNGQGYLDDILVSGKTAEEHLVNLKRVLQKLKEHGICARKSKCAFCKSSVQYLGHRIDAEGIHATDAKLKAIIDAPSPKNIAELRSSVY